MQLTTADLQRFVGGQIEVRQNASHGYHYRGTISVIRVEGGSDGGELVVETEWMACSVGANVGLGKWLMSSRTSYGANLSIYGATDDGGGRIALYSSIVGEKIVLHPKGGSMLARSRVEGL